MSAPAIVEPPAVNMLSNGTFDDATDWTCSSVVWTITGGKANYDNTGNSRIYQASGDMVISIEASTAYTITFDVDIIAGAPPELTLQFCSSNALIVYAAYANFTEGAMSASFTTPSDIGDGGLGIRAAVGGATATIDNLVLTED